MATIDLDTDVHEVAVGPDGTVGAAAGPAPCTSGLTNDGTSPPLAPTSWHTPRGGTYASIDSGRSWTQAVHRMQAVNEVIITARR